MFLSFLLYDTAAKLDIDLKPTESKLVFSQSY